MDFISFRCSNCNRGLKIGADKAGRKIKCTKCGAELTVPDPASAEAKQAPAKASPELPPEPPRKDLDEDEDADYDKKGYALFVDPTETEKKPEDKPKKAEKSKAPPPKRKFRTLSDPDLWEKTKTGLQIIMVGVNIWGGVVLFMLLMLILGIVNGPEYAELLEKSMTETTNTPAGEVVKPDMPAFMFGLVTGQSYQGIGKILYILASVLALFQAIVLMTGYAVCLKIPDRFGMKGQLLGLLGVSGFNFLIVLLFKLLPALGILKYLLVPYALPEVSLGEGNIDRNLPIWVSWSPSPFWEMIVTVLFLVSFYAEPALIGVFIWSIGLTLKEEPIAEKGQGITVMTLGIAFALISFQLLSMAGTSAVAVGLLRVVYGCWIGFTILLLIRLPMALQATREILQKYLDGAEMKEDEDDEEEEPKKAKPKRPTKRSSDEDEDDEDED